MGDQTDILDGSLRNPSHVSLRQREQNSHTVIVGEEELIYSIIPWMMVSDILVYIASLVDREET